MSGYYTPYMIDCKQNSYKHKSMNYLWITWLRLRYESYIYQNHTVVSLSAITKTNLI